MCCIFFQSSPLLWVQAAFLWPVCFCCGWLICVVSHLPYTLEGRTVAGLCTVFLNCWSIACDWAGARTGSVYLVFIADDFHTGHVRTSFQGLGHLVTKIWMRHASFVQVRKAMFICCPLQRSLVSVHTTNLQLCWHCPRGRQSLACSTIGSMISTTDVLGGCEA